MDRLRRVDLGAVLIGLMIVGVGIYYLLENWFGLSMPELDWDKLWPLAVIILGVGILWSAWSRIGRSGRGPQGT
jgi:divalent metal cation (Fe/Co/Zn/Cd) transporter